MHSLYPLVSSKWSFIAGKLVHDLLIFHRHVELRDGNCCIAQGFVRSLLTRSQVGYIPRYDEEYFFCLFVRIQIPLFVWGVPGVTLVLIGSLVFVFWIFFLVVLHLRFLWPLPTIS